MYRWVVFAYVLAIFGFLVAHGASAAVIFKLRGEREVERIRVLLDLSRGANSVANACLLVLLLAGIVAAFMGGWWSYGWVWVSLGVLVLISASMFAFGSRPLILIRQLIQPELWRHEKREAVEPPSPEVVAQRLPALLAATRPWAITLIGGAGWPSSSG